MKTQPEALRLADNLDYLVEIGDYAGTATDAAIELRRLHWLNAELLKALKENTIAFDVASDDGGINFYAYAQDNRAIIAKAEAQ